MKNGIIGIFISCVYLPMAFPNPEGFAQSSAPYLFGVITTKDNHSYSGLIRWGNEEVFWTDVLNSTKTSNDYMNYPFESNQTYTPGVIRTFECMFGDIRSLKIISSSRVDLELKNGFVFRLKNGSNDIGATIGVIDSKEGLVNLPWEKIKKIEFRDSSLYHKEVFGHPVSGTVQTTQGAFTGLIEWDQDERLTTDILDGNFEEEGMKIPFSDILTIYKKGEGSQVILATGEEYYLTGSNDVNGENRGIVITIAQLGRIVVPWEAFVKVTLNAGHEFKGLAYNDFPVPQTLKGTVFANNGQTYAGLLIYDQDESFDLEFLQGKIQNIEYQIPFRNIVSISPIDDVSSSVLLTSGEKLILGGMQDVTSANDGIMVYENNSSYTIVSWDELMEVRFK